jgi:hypothetical protein
MSVVPHFRQMSLALLLDKMAVQPAHSLTHALKTKLCRLALPGLEPNHDCGSAGGMPAASAKLA